MRPLTRWLAACGLLLIAGNAQAALHLQLKTEGGTGSGANIMDFPNDDHRALLQDFVDAVTQNRPPRVTGLDALHTQQLIGQVLASAGGMSQA